MPPLIGMRPIHATLLCSLAACAIDPAEDGEPIEDDPVETEPIASCVTPQAPFTNDLHWYFSEYITHKSIGRANYATGPCGAYTIGMSDGTNGKVTAYLGAQTAEECLGTRLSVTQAMYFVNAWYVDQHANAYGEWTVDGCRMPTIEFGGGGAEISVRIHVQRTVCTGGYCTTTHNLPFYASADYYEPHHF